MIPQCDDTAAASAIDLAIQNTPSETSERKSNVLLPEFDAQAAVERSELPLQERIQLWEQHAQQVEADKFAMEQLQRTQQGKRPQPQPTDRTTDQIVKTLLERIDYLEGLLQRFTLVPTNSETTAPMQVILATPTTTSPASYPL